MPTCARAAPSRGPGTGAARGAAAGPCSAAARNASQRTHTQQQQQVHLHVPQQHPPLQRQLQPLLQLLQLPHLLQRLRYRMAF